MSRKIEKHIGTVASAFAIARELNPEAYIDGFLGGYALAGKIQELKDEGKTKEDILAFLSLVIEDSLRGDGPKFDTIEQRRTKQAGKN